MICPEVSTHLGFLHSFGRSSALGSIVVQGLGMLRILISLIFFLQLCRYHPLCHYFCVVRVVMDIFINQGASKLFIDFCFVFAEVRNSGGFCTCACVLLLRWS